MCQRSVNTCEQRVESLDEKRRGLRWSHTHHEFHSLLVFVSLEAGSCVCVRPQPFEPCVCECLHFRCRPGGTTAITTLSSRTPRALSRSIVGDSTCHPFKSFKPRTVLLAQSAAIAVAAGFSQIFARFYKTLFPRNKNLQLVHVLFDDLNPERQNQYGLEWRDNVDEVTFW